MIMKIKNFKLQIINHAPVRGTRIRNLSSYPYHSRKGLTLAELIVGIGIFALIALGIYSVFALSVKLSAAAKARATATALANEQVEIIRNLPYASVGTVGGVPSGLLEPVKVVVRSNITYTIQTTIRNVDDPADSLADGVPADTSPADYKLVEVNVECVYCTGNPPLVFTTTVAPKNLETSSTNGSLFIRVFDASGLPVAGASVQVENATVSPPINVSDVTDVNGLLQLIDIPPATGTYSITVGKVGYSTDRTYALGDPVNPNPVKPHASVFTQQVTQVSFAIDKVSNLTLNTIIATSTQLTFGANASFAMGRTGEIDLATIDNDELVIAYADVDDGNRGKVLVASTTGSAVEFGAPQTFFADQTAELGVTVLTATKVIISYQDKTGNSKGKVLVGTRAGEVFSFGAPVEFENNKVDEIDVAALDSTHFVIAYQNESGGDKGNVIYGTLNADDSLTLGSPQIFYGGKSGEIGTVALTSTQLLIAFQDQTDADKGKIILGTLSGSSFSFSTPVTFLGARVDEVSITELNSTRFVIAYQDESNGDKGKAFIGSLLDGNFTFNPTVLFANLNVQEVAITALSSTQLVVAYVDKNDGYKGKLLLGSVLWSDSSSIVRVPNVPLTLTGAKIIGYNGTTPIYKYREDMTTNAEAAATLANMEWDSYTVDIDDQVAGYDIAYVDPAQPFYLIPDTSMSTMIGLSPNSANTLLVVVVDLSGHQVSDASVRLSHSGLSYNKYITTNSQGQAFFNALSSSTYTLEVGGIGYATSTLSAAIAGWTSIPVTLTP